MPTRFINNRSPLYSSTFYTPLFIFIWHVCSFRLFLFGLHNTPDYCSWLLFLVYTFASNTFDKSHQWIATHNHIREQPFNIYKGSGQRNWRINFVSYRQFMKNRTYIIDIKINVCFSGMARKVCFAGNLLVPHIYHMAAPKPTNNWTHISTHTCTQSYTLSQLCTLVNTQNTYWHMRFSSVLVWKSETAFCTIPAVQFVPAKLQVK